MAASPASVSTTGALPNLTAIHYGRAAKRILGGARKRVSAKKRRSNSLVSDKIKVLRKEKMPEKQAIATAISMNRAGRLRPGGVYVPAKKK